MTTPRFIRFALVAAVFFALIGCTSAGQAYLGTWENTRNAHDRLEITRNDGNFLIKATTPANEVRTFPATLNDGDLEIKSDFRTSRLTYIQATDTLTTPGFLSGEIEYRRTK